MNEDTDLSTEVELPQPKKIAKDDIPQTYEQFLLFNNIKDWPDKIPEESRISFKDKSQSFGTLEAITQWLKEAAPIDMAGLDNLESRRMAFETDLRHYSDRMITVDSDDILSTRHVNKTEALVTRLSKKVNAKSDLLKTRRSKKNSKKKGPSIHEMKGKSVKHCSFPGFFETELTELPGSIESPQILHRVSKCVPVGHGFKTFWNKIFLSEASIAILQDSFWWFFIDMFEEDDLVEERRQLFNRIADSFVALFISINPEVKDQFLNLYPESIAMALYAVFVEAFPESRKLFSDEFKQKVINTIAEWMTGGFPLAGSYKCWNTDLLEGVSSLTTAVASTDGPAKSVSDSVMQAVLAMNDPKVAIFVDDGSGQHDMTKTEELSTPTQSRAKASVPRSSALLGTTVKPAPVTQSHPMGEGGTFNRLVFDLRGHCPLIQHYLAMHGKELRNPEDVHVRVRRTELGRVPSGKKTYQEFIGEQKKHSELMKAGYDQISKETESALKAIAVRNRQINTQIQKLQQELNETSGTLELKLMASIVMDEIQKK